MQFRSTIGDHDDLEAAAHSMTTKDTDDRVPTEKRGRSTAQYPDHYNLMLRVGDRQRFDDYAYRHRLKKGEAMSRLLDLAEADESRQMQEAKRGQSKQTDGSDR